MGMTMEATTKLRGRYQESLRAIGAWLDIRGFREVRIIEADGELLIEAAGPEGEAAVTERIHLDAASIGRLCQAARNDRGSAISYRPIEDAFPALS
jgi:hypothetical protein